MAASRVRSPTSPVATNVVGIAQNESANITRHPTATSRHRSGSLRLLKYCAWPVLLRAGYGDTSGRPGSGWGTATEAYALRAEGLLDLSGVPTLTAANQASDRDVFLGGTDLETASPFERGQGCALLRDKRLRRPRWRFAFSRCSHPLPLTPTVVAAGGGHGGGGGRGGGGGYHGGSTSSASVSRGAWGGSAYGSPAFSLPAAVGRDSPRT
jgi:hypothetical protein